MPSLNLLENLIHGICTFHCLWLPGDERGFRSHGHRIHSSGDYRDRPPEEEHAGLRRFIRSNVTANPVMLIRPEFVQVGSAFRDKLVRIGGIVHVISCGATHVHVLYNSQAEDALQELGRAKQYSSVMLRNRPGKIWAEGGKIIRVKSREHARNAFQYICDHAEKEGAWVWRANEQIEG